VAAVLLLDLSHYGIHRAFHAVPLLWRIHEVHHSDPDYDVSTAARFHPLEVVLARGGYLAAVVLLAPPPIAVFVSEALTVVFNFFAHANVSLPRQGGKLLGLVFITPDLHRIHHSADSADHSRNYGQTFAWWDRLFGTCLNEPNVGTERMTTGISGLRNAGSLRLGFVLKRPFESRRAWHVNAKPIKRAPGLTAASTAS
jgi:sterol desaturase/sphingolipid hydroxylase (fatty acid hydroxylase superfamily)